MLTRYLEYSTGGELAYHQDSLALFLKEQPAHRKAGQLKAFLTKPQT